MNAGIIQGIGATRMQLIYEECGTTREQGKDTTTDYFNVQSLRSSTYRDMAPQLSHK